MSVVVIMAAGKSRRWTGAWPKQLSPVHHGEPVLYRTVRQLRQRGIEPIVTSRYRGQWGLFNEHVTAPNEVEIDRIYGAHQFAPALFLYGDCFYTDDAIDVILSRDVDWCFFGRRGRSDIKSHGEIMAIKANEFVLQKLESLRQQCLRSRGRCIGWDLCAACTGVRLVGTEGSHERFVDLPDCDDFDTTDEYAQFVRRRLTSPPERNPPVKRLAVVTYYFNMNDSATLIDNYRRFIDALRCQVVSAEVSFDGRHASGSEIQINGGQMHMMFQKEALINLAIESLPDDIDAVAWIDPDLLFPSTNWMEMALSKLNEGFQAVQPFRTIEFLDSTGQTAERAFSYASNRGPRQCGRAWVARRSFLEQIGGLYPYNVTGMGDQFFVAGLLGRHPTGRQWSLTHRHSVGYRQSVKAYQDRVQAAKSRTFTDIDLTVRHLFHGERTSRRYEEGARILERYSYDPARDVILNQDGILEWSSEKAELHDAVRAFWCSIR